VVQEHIETYMCLCAEGTWDGSTVPFYVEREFRRYLEIWHSGPWFSKGACPECGHHLLIAYSCPAKGEGPVLQHLAHGGDGSAFGRSCLPAGSSTPVSALGAEAAALVPGAVAERRQRDAITSFAGR